MVLFIAKRTRNGILRPNAAGAVVPHHRERLEEVLSILQYGPQNAYETASRMTWDIDCSSWTAFPVSQKWFATSEAIAHLRYLEDEGKIVRGEHEGCRVYSLA